MQALTWAQVWTYRLTQHALLNPAPAADLAAVVGTVCGIHAQIMPAAELSLGIRVAGITRRDVRAALWETKSLVKTTGIRGTIHLFPAADLPLWMAALRTREAEDIPRLARQGLDATGLDTVVEALSAVLTGQGQTLKELDQKMEQRLGAWAVETVGLAWVNGWPRWRTAIGTAAVRGQLCYGPPRGTEITFVRPDQWLGTGPWRDLDPQESLAEVFRRYLHAYGPATARDFAQWIGLPPRATRDLPTTLAAELVEGDVEGDRGHLLATDLPAFGPEAPESVHLLPHFDCYLIGCHPRPRLFSPEAKARTLSHTGQAGTVPVLLIDGVVAGLWKREGTARSITLSVEPFTPLTSRQHTALESAAARLGTILEAPPTLTLGPITVRPHL